MIVVEELALILDGCGGVWTSAGYGPYMHDNNNNNNDKRGYLHTFYQLIRISKGNRTTAERVWFSTLHIALPMIKTTT